MCGVVAVSMKAKHLTCIFMECSARHAEFIVREYSTWHAESIYKVINIENSMKNISLIFNVSCLIPGFLIKNDY